MRVLFWMFTGFDRHSTSEHLLSAIIEQLCECGHSVHIVQKNTGGSLPAIPEKLSHYSITTDVVHFHMTNKRNFIARYLSELEYIYNCKKHFSFDYDAIFIQSTTVAGFAVKVIKKKYPKRIITLNVQDIFPYNAVYSGSIQKDGLLFKVLAWIQRYGYKKTSHIITISDDMKKTLIEDGVKADKIEVIYNWSYQDEPYYNIDLSAAPNMFSRDYFNIVYAGNIGVMQNVDIIIEAANLLKKENHIWFHIVGDGVYKKRLEKKAKEYNLDNISFWEMVDPELAPIIYSSADVNIIPLVKNVYKTALPSKTAICLACGKPIIFAIGKDSEFGKIASEKGCKVIDSDNVKEMVNAIEDIMYSTLNANRLIDYYNEFFKRSINSKKYSNIITDNR